MEVYVVPPVLKASLSMSLFKPSFLLVYEQH